MNELESMRTRYLIYIGVSFVIAVIMLSYGRTLIPVKYTQILLLKDSAFSHGIHENIISIEDQIKSGSLKLQDNVPYPITTASYRANIIKMTESQPDTVKYRLEVRFNYPYSELPRFTKLDAILVDLKREQNHEFLDLFWNLE